MRTSRWLVPALTGFTCLFIVTAARAAGEEPAVTPTDAAPAAETAEAPAADTDAPTGADVVADDLGMTGALRAYTDWLTRHPARYASPADFDAATADANARRNWRLFFQTANIGFDDDRSDWRQRAGGVVDSLLIDGDRFHIAYQNGGFDSPLINNILDVKHAVVGGYEAPLPGLDHFRAGVVGAWSSLSQEVDDFFDVTYTGHDDSIAGELIYRMIGDGPDALTVDFLGGFRYRHQQIRDEFVDVEADGDFYMPYAGVRASEHSNVHSSWSEVIVEGAFADGAAEELGRLGTDNEWATLRWDLGRSVYAEAVLNWLHGDGLTAPKDRPMVHELWLATHGQFVLGDERLPPYFIREITGQYGVRGYAESLVGGDDSIVFTFEYRFHAPRLLPLQDPPAQLFGQPFRLAPQTPTGDTDWDLVLAAFIDVGYIDINDPRSFERDNQSIYGAGFGVELIPCAHMHVRADWAWALKDLPFSTSAGSGQFHLAATLVY
ncbi:MAG: hypothetical protein GC159_05950 [Phycisphaera sp.]|nr:hypothetical protein [Phycisphaera sp.]